MWVEHVAAWKVYGLVVMLLGPLVLALLTEVICPVDKETGRRYFRFTPNADKSQ